MNVCVCVCVSGLEMVSCDLLREGAPIEPVPPVSHWKPEAVVSALSFSLTHTRITRVEWIIDNSVVCPRSHAAIRENTK